MMLKPDLEAPTRPPATLQPPSARTRGLLLFAHGARDPRWAEPFQDVQRHVQRLQPGVAVQLAFLEFMNPTLPAACAELVAAGCTHIDVVPLFLGSGGHVRKDLPLLLQAVRAAHPQVPFTLHPAVGEIDGVVAAMAAAAVAALGSAP